MEYSDYFNANNIQFNTNNQGESGSPCQQPHQQHRLIKAYTNNNKKECAFCRLNKVRTKSGWRPNTHYKCEACDLPFCKLKNCFGIYHKMIYERFDPSQAFQQST